MEKVLFNWSGGKDSALCLYKIITNNNYEISRLITTVNDNTGRVSMHGIREELLDQQAASLGLSLHKVRLPEQVPMNVYDTLMRDTLRAFSGEDIQYSVFGDIFLEDLRAYREQRLSEVGMKALFPLWKKSTRILAREFIELGFKAVVVCVDGSRLDRTFAGKDYDREFLDKLPDEVDPCGERGEFHTFVYDGPIFRRRVPFKFGEIVPKDYRINAETTDANNMDPSTSDDDPSSFTYWFCDLLSDDR